jgi:hypothetical protein
VLQRAAVIAVVLGLVACKEPAPKVVVARNGSAQMTVPGNWKEDPDLNDEADVQASRRLSELYAMVLSEPRGPLGDANVDEVSELTRSRQLASFTGASEKGPVRRIIHGHPAVQYELRGAGENGLRIVMLHTVIETPERFLQVLAWTTEERWEKHQERLQKIVDSVQVPGEAPGPATDARAADEPKPYEVVAADGSIRLTVPGQWKELSELNDSAVLQVGRRVMARYAIVLVDEREELPDESSLEEISKTGRTALLSGLTNAKETGPERRSIGTYPALQYQIEGSADEQSVVMLHTTFETPTRFVQVVAWTVKERWGQDKALLQAVVDSAREADAR